MKENRIRSMLAGFILGLIFGFFYYVIFAKTLITGPMELSLFDRISSELNWSINFLALKWGGGLGIIIGLIYGFRTSISMPRGFLSRRISFVSYFITVGAAFVMQGKYMFDISIGKNILIVISAIMMIPLSLLYGQLLSFIEKIRE